MPLFESHPTTRMLDALEEKGEPLLETATLPRVFRFAEGRISGIRQRPSLPRADPRQRGTLGKGFFAKGRTLDRETPSVKAHLCRGRQRRGARRCGSRVTAALEVRHCRAPVVKPSAKLCRRSCFAEGPPACPRQHLSLPRVWSGPSAIFFLFFWIYVFFLSVAHLHYFKLHVKVWFILK